MYARGYENRFQAGGKISLVAGGHFAQKSAPSPSQKGMRREFDPNRAAVSRLITGFQILSPNGRLPRVDLTSQDAILEKSIGTHRPFRAAR
jgi:hypothetical protein